MQAPPPPDEDGRQPLPQFTTPTWEMELLISGATVFSLLQLPELLDHAFYALFPRVEASIAAVITLPYTYVIAATYALIATFVLHLGTRAYWVALVGLRSIYPDGVQWDGLKWGPAYKRAMMERFPTLAVVVERADNRASSVFGFGIGFALSLLAPLLLMLVLSLLTYAIFELSGRAVDWHTLWSLVIAAVFVPFLLVLMIDRFAAGRIHADGFLRRAAAGVLVRYLRSGFSSITNYPVMLFFSRFGQYRSSAITMLGIFAVLGFVLLRMLVREDVLRLDGYTTLPPVAELRGHVLNPRHYADQRAAKFSLVTRPYIQSEVIEGDYIRLFVPYNPSRDAAAMAAICGELPSVDAKSGGEAGAAMLACASRIHDVSIDGNRVDLQFDLANEPELGLRGFVAMIDATGLARGRHELDVERVPTGAAVAENPNRHGVREQGAKPQTIIFWR